MLLFFYTALPLSFSAIYAWLQSMDLPDKHRCISRCPNQSAHPHLLVVSGAVASCRDRCLSHATQPSASYSLRVISIQQSPLCLAHATDVPQVKELPLARTASSGASSMRSHSEI
ncbi:hypothetical protein GQ54DRAFT_303706 [Martensiomyces pterosporus]|nr:hypothetical protein GQ54DRAFT_303706 [Martensiomyces pterosporus]